MVAPMAPHRASVRTITTQASWCSTDTMVNAANIAATVATDPRTVPLTATARTGMSRMMLSPDGLLVWERMSSVAEQR